MRARALAGGVVASAAVLTAAWQIGAQHAASSVTAAPAAGSTSAGSGSTSGSASTPSSSASSGSSAATPSPTASSGTSSGSTGSSSGSSKSGASGTFQGTSAQTPYGNVQVEIVVASGKITDVKALQLTDEGGRSVEISNYAAPILRQEALKAQSANIQSVSGATFTSQGYITSLQAAIDKAGL